MTKRILVVDDDLFIRELYEEILRDEGFTVDSANDGEEGLKKINEGGYDLILLDVMMPKKDGLTVLGEMKQNGKEKKNGPTLLLTNLGHDPIIREALQKGATAYLNKAEMTPDQLVEKIKAYFN